MAQRSTVSRRPGGLLWQHDFRMLWCGETVSKIGSNVTTVALPLIAVLTLHADTFVVGVLTAAVWLPWPLLGLLVGAWVDRMARRPIMLCCDVVSALLFLSVPVAAWFGALTLAHLLAVAFLAGAASVFFSTAYRVYLPSIVAPDDLPEGNAKLSGSESAAQLIGRSVAGLIAQWLGAVLGLLADAVSFLVSAGCLLAIRHTENVVRDTERSVTMRQDIREGLRWVVGDPYLRAFALFGGLGNLALTGLQALQVVFLIRVVGVGAAAVGGLAAVNGAGGILGALLATPISRRFGSARALVLCLAITLPCGLLIPFATKGPGITVLVVGLLMVSIGVVVGNIITGSFRQRYCPPRLRGRIVAGTATLAYSAIPVGALLAGWLGSTFGVRPALFVMMGLLVAAGVIVFASPVPRRRELPTEPGR